MPLLHCDSNSHPTQPREAYVTFTLRDFSAAMRRTRSHVFTRSIRLLRSCAASRLLGSCILASMVSLPPFEQIRSHAGRLTVAPLPS